MRPTVRGVQSRGNGGGSWRHSGPCVRSLGSRPGRLQELEPVLLSQLGAALAPPDLQLILGLDSRPLEGSPPFLASLRLLPLALDRRLLVVRSPLHLLEESPLEHHLLEGLQGGFDLVVRHLDLRPGQTRHRPRKCEVDRYGRGGSDRSTVFICPSRRVPSATAIAIVPNTSRDSSTSSPA